MAIDENVIQEAKAQMVAGIDVAKAMFQAASLDKEYQKALASFAKNMRNAYLDEGFTGEEAIYLVVGNIAKMSSTA